MKHPKIATIERTAPGCNLAVKRGKGNWRYRPVGAILIRPANKHRRRPHVIVKVRDGGPEDGRWRYLAVVVWERAHGPVSDGCCLWFLNRDSLDCRIENLEAITLAERLKRNMADNHDTWLANNRPQAVANGKKYWRAALDARRVKAARRKRNGEASRRGRGERGEPNINAANGGKGETMKQLTVDSGQLTAKGSKRKAAPPTGKKSGRGRSPARRLRAMRPGARTLGTLARDKEDAAIGSVLCSSRKEWERISPALMPLGMPITQLHADPDNARRHPDRNIEAIMASLAKFGQQAPAVFVLRKGKKIIIKGNGLLAAAKSLGWTRLAAVRSGLAEQDAKAYAIADNRTTDLSEFDEELLAAQLAELDEADYDLAAVGFTDAEMQDLLKDAGLYDGGDGEEGEGEGGTRKRGERIALVIVGHLKFELPRVEFDRWLAAVEAKVGNDPDRVVREIKRRLKLS